MCIGIVFLGIDGHMQVSVGDLSLNPGYSQPENIATCISTTPAKCVNHTRDYYPNVHPPPMPPAITATVATRAAADAAAITIADIISISTPAPPTHVHEHDD